MKIQLFSLLFIAFISTIYAQNGDDSLQVFHVHQKEYLSFRGQEIINRNTDYRFSIQKIDSVNYQACYYGGLSNSILAFDDFSPQLTIMTDSSQACFSYKIINGILFPLSDYQEVLEQIKKLQDKSFPNRNDINTKLLQANINTLLQNHRKLRERLRMELLKIHAFKQLNVPRNIEGMIPQDEDLKLDKLKNNKTQVLDTINWENVFALATYQTPDISEEEYLFDLMMTSLIYGVENPPAFRTIVNHFFDQDFVVDEYDLISLDREQVKMDKQTNQLNYLLNEYRRVSDETKNIKKFELRRIHK